MISEKPELLNCPFCGKEPRYVPADYVDNHGQPWPFSECNPCNVGAPVEFWNKRAAKPTGEQVAWSYCPECGSEKIHHQEGEHKQCAECHQEWFSDIAYKDVVRGHLKKIKAEQAAPVAVALPERLDLPHRDEFESADQYAAATGEAKNWNSCLDELKRLNPSL